jgi:hypothetical protein
MQQVGALSGCRQDHQRIGKDRESQAEIELSHHLREAIPGSAGAVWP